MEDRSIEHLKDFRELLCSATQNFTGDEYSTIVKEIEKLVTSITSK